MKSTIFKNLIKRAECESWGLGEIAFRAEYRNYILSFWQDDGEFKIEECVKSTQRGWEDIELSSDQIEVLKGIIKEKENDLLEAQEYERRLEIENENDYFEY